MSSEARAPWLTIVGIGEDGRAGLSPAAAAALDAAEFVAGGARHLALAAPLAAQTMAWPSPIAEGYEAVLARRGRPTCVLASGDPFHYGIGAELAKRVPAAEIRAYPHLSAFSLAAARLGWSIPDCALVSLHGRASSRIVPELVPGARVLALTSDGNTAREVAAMLVARGMGASRLVILEALGGPRERVREARAEGFALDDIDPLNLLAVEVAGGAGAIALPRAAGLDDTLFESDGQLTKAEIRAITLAALRPLPGGLMWDVGIGAGSVAIEWCLAHPRNRALGLEERPDRAARARANAERLGAAALAIHDGIAPNGLSGWPAPDAIFIGGGAGDPGVVEACWEALKPGGRIVINAVSLETEAILARLHAAHGGTMRRIAISRLDRVGNMHGWRPAMPVTQWVAAKP